MTNEEAKAHRERQVFLEFVRQSALPIDADTIEGRRPPEPDIYCMLGGQGAAFELAELCNSDLAKEVSRLKKTGGDGQFMMLDDPTPQVFLKKIGKSYRSNHPVELLAYTDGILVTPDDVIIPVLQDLIRTHGCGQFRRVWLLGEKTCCEIAP